MGGSPDKETCAAGRFRIGNRLGLRLVAAAGDRRCEFHVRSVAKGLLIGVEGLLLVLNNALFEKDNVLVLISILDSVVDL